MKIVRRRISFDSTAYIRNMLTNNGRVRESAEFMEAMQSFERSLRSDPRHNIRGHDFTEVFFRVAKKLKPRLTPAKLEQFEHALVACIELASVEREVLFRELARF